MTKTTYVNAIYLGNFASVDTNESDYDAEHEAALTGVTVDHGTLQVVSLRLDDKDHNGTISDDECNPYCDKVTYDIGSGQVSNQTDATLTGYVTLTLGDGSTRTVEALLTQQANGDLFLNDLLNCGTLDNLQISSVTIDSFTCDNYAGWYTNQSVDNTSIVAPAPAGDGIVEGTAGDDVIDVAYTGDPEGDRIDAGDALAPNSGDEDIVDAGCGDDEVHAGAANDEVYAGGGDDTVFGDAGNDTIYGDRSLGEADNNGDAKILDWGSIGDGTGIVEGCPVDIDADGINVHVSFDKQDYGATAKATSAQQYVDAASGETFDTNSALELFGKGGEGGWDNTSTTRLDFSATNAAYSDEVQNVAFRINDIDEGTSSDDHIDRVTIRAFDAQGNAVDVQLTAGSFISLSGDTATGDENFDTDYGPDDARGSLLVEIAGPVSYIEIDYDNGECTDQKVWVSDVHFDTIGTVADCAPGDDSLLGGTGDDVLYGEGGNDTLLGGTGDDYAEGGDGNDFIDDALGSDDGQGNDTYLGGAGNDTIYGGNDDDLIDGGTGNDLLNGEEGDDSILGGSGDDTLHGEGGADTILGGSGNDFALGGTGGDSIRGKDGNDTLCGQDGDDTLIGGAGSDLLEGMNDNDLLYGGDDNDTLYGDAGSDTLYGDEGDDRLLGGVGNDTLDGGAGNDILRGNADRDVIFAGGGDDVDGGSAGDDYDILDLTGQGAYYLENVTADTNGNGFNGTVVFVDGEGTPTGETINFVEIEEIRGTEFNRGPDAVDDSVTGDEDTVITGNVLANDTDPDSDPLTVVSNTDPANGAVTVNPDGSFEYTPNPDSNGTDSFTYTVSDGQGGTDTATVTITVGAVNDDPDAVNDSATTPFDTPIVVDVLGNDTDPENDPLTVIGTTDGANGTVALDPVTGNPVYTPNPGFAGTDQFTYTISDGNGGTDTATVTITVEPDPRDGIVEGTGGDDLIDVAYTGDPEGDMIDAGDAILPGDAPNDDVVEAGDGNDTVLAGVGDDEVYGGAGNDELLGEDGDDSLYGEDGDDTLRGGMGDDLIDGGDGNDSVRANEGEDTVIGGAGNDTLRGGEDNDTVDGGADDDLLYGGLGDDSVLGGDGDDELRGNEGSDTLLGGDGNDSIAADDPGDVLDAETFVGVPFEEFPDTENNRDYVDGGAGNDTIDGGDDADTLIGGTGDDVIEGGIDNDSITGNDGNDSITDIQGADFIDGGAGDDTIIAGVDTFSDYVGDDPNLPNPLLIDPATGLPALSDPNTEDGKDTVLGGDGNDFIATGDDADYIDGGADNDTIDAGIDDDTVVGGSGDDSIIGGHGSDSILGEDGDDWINAGDSSLLFGQAPDASDPVPTNGRDFVDGGAGNDTIFGEDDEDTLLGGDGDDVIDGGIDDDLIEGGDGFDSLLGGQGDDTIVGGAGNDTIIGGDGADNLAGGDDRDLFTDVGVGDVIDGDAGGDDHDVLDLTGSAPAGGSLNVTITGPDSNGNGVNGFVTYFDATGSEIGRLDFTEIEEIVPCFTPGTTIATPQGERLVEDLKTGDRVITRDNGIQEIRWIGAKPVTGVELAKNPHLKPVLIRKGALGNGLPERDMLVSPNHRLLVNNDKTALYFEEREVLAAAKHLVGADGIHEVDVMSTTYIHFMFDHHEVVLSNGSWTESFQPGDMSLKGVGNAQRNEIFELFPELRTREGIDDYQAARRALKKHEAKLLVK